jgi:peroxiredoxin
MSPGSFEVMIVEGNHAPNFTVPLAGGEAYNDISEFTLSTVIGDGAVILAFVPGAFTGGCTTEMCTLGNRMDSLEALDASVYGISVDLPFAQNTWMQQEGFDVPMLSDCSHEVIREYDVVYPDMYEIVEAAQRSIFIIDTDGIASYRWSRDGENPDFNSLIDTVRDELKLLRE